MIFLYHDPAIQGLSLKPDRILMKNLFLILILCTGVNVKAQLNIADTIYGMRESCIPRSPGSAVYSVDPVPGVANYNWTLPAQMNIISGQGTSQIQAQWSNASSYAGITGSICVAMENAAGQGPDFCLPLDLQI